MRGVRMLHRVALALRMGHVCLEVIVRGPERAILEGTKQIRNGRSVTTRRPHIFQICSAQI